jgi:TolA-binding protein
MKKSYTLLTVLLSAMFFGNMGCVSGSTEKMKNAVVETDEVEKNVTEAKIEYLADMEDYMKEINTKISENRQSITEFKVRVSNSKKEGKVEYEKRINDLEMKNKDVKRKMDEYKTESKDKWSAFKIEFSHDMDELSNALKDLTVNSMK